MIKDQLGHQYGITGVGEAGLAYDLGQQPANMIKEFAQEMVIGSDPFVSEKLWDRMLREIKGKALGMPVYQKA